MRHFLFFTLSLVIFFSCKKKNESLPAFYVAMNVNNQRLVLTHTEVVLEESPLLFSFSARDSGNHYQVHFTTTNFTKGSYPQVSDTTVAPDFTKPFWIDCNYHPAGGNWYFLRPITGKEPGTLTISAVDDRIVSGSFHAWIRAAGQDTLQLTNGTFRVQLP